MLYISHFLKESKLTESQVKDIIKEKCNCLNSDILVMEKEGYWEGICISKSLTDNPFKMVKIISRNDVRC